MGYAIPSKPVDRATVLHVLISPGCPLPSANVSSTLPAGPQHQGCAWTDDLRQRYGLLRASGANMVISDADQACRLVGACLACRASAKPTAPRVLLVTADESDDGGRSMMEAEESAGGHASRHYLRRVLLDALRKLVWSAHSVTRPGDALVRGGMALGSLRRTREHIDRQLARKISLRELARVAGLSSGHFSRAFKQSVGMPPYHYILHRRISAAAHLIRCTDRPLAEIALSVGFSDQSHFTRTFVRARGETPYEFRRRYR